MEELNIQNQMTRENRESKHCQILKKTFSVMQNVFTSNDFGMQARAFGMSKHVTSSGVISYFLKKHCIQLGTKRYWRKLNKEKTLNQKEPLNNVINLSDKESEAVTYLKSLGYKIMKPLTQWEEI